jgi:Icc-related predicted phosphoesterase
MKTIVAISDTHGTHLELDLPKGDILLHTGDGLDLGSEAELIRLNNWFGSIRSDFQHILYVPGNHDIIIGEDPDYGRELMSNATILIDQLFEIDGKRIYGTPWTPRYGDWEFMKPDLNLMAHWEKIPNEVDVLATHGPPYGILDRNYRGDLCGSQTLMKAVYEKKPRFHCFGHIHEGAAGGGRYYIEPTTFINSSIVVNWFDTREKNPQVFEI